MHRLSMSLQRGLTTSKVNDILDCLRSKARKTWEVVISLSDTSEAASGFPGPVLGLHFKKVMERDQPEM